ncbi:hypothetical protein H0H93_008917 [Arthromyces matolae]|nr:hypothetical protein H0H93_008917 [Arthromyces matolae]
MTSFSVACTVCGSQFTSDTRSRAKAARDAHLRLCAKSVSVAYSNVTLTLTRNPEDDCFLCICNHHPDGHLFTLTHSLKQHVRTSGCAWVGPTPTKDQVSNTLSVPLPPTSESPCGDFASSNEAAVDGVIDNPNVNPVDAIRKLGLMYCVTLKSLICIDCKIVLAPDNIYGHLHNTHKDISGGANKKKLQTIVGGLDLASSIPVMSLDPVPEILGLDVVQHYQKHHPGLTMPKSLPLVPAQRLDNRFSSTWFPVIPALTQGPTDTVKIVGELRAAQELLQTRPTGRTLDPRLESPWLKSTHWRDLIAGQQVSELIAFASLPGKDEFPRLAECLKELMLASSNLLDVVPELTLQHLNTPDPSKTGISNTPFHRHQQHEDRMTTYVRPVVRLVALLLRKKTVLLEWKVPESVVKRVTGLRLTLENPKSSTSEIQTKLYQLLVHLWTQKWDTHPKLPTTDPTILSLALSMLQTDGSFKHPKYTTGPIAQLEYCMRTIFVMYLHTKVEKNGTDYSVETELLSVWFTEKHESTFNKLRSLQHRASAIAEMSVSLPQVWWLDRQTFKTMLFHGISINFTDIQNLFTVLENKLLECYNRHVLILTDLYFPYDQLCDDLANTTAGYSFMTDPKNPFARDRDLLMRKVLDNPDLRSKFVAFEDKDGHIEWNKTRLRQWLVQYSKFQGLLLARAHMLGGSPGRGTELTAMTFKNIPTSTHRNCVVFGKYLAMLVTYHKGTAMTGSEKLIPHAFDGLTSDLIIQDLAIARPFAELAAFICYPDEPSVQQLYRDHLFVNNTKLFTSDQVTSIMESLTEPVLGIKLGLQKWRQVSIAFKRKRCTELEDLMDVDEEDTVTALQASHSRRTENRIYGLSPDALSGVGEDVLPLYLDASTDWQIESLVVPGGLGLPYKECIHSNFIPLVHAKRIKRGPSGTHKEQQPVTVSDLQEAMSNLAKNIAGDVITSVTQTLSETIVPNIIRSFASEVRKEQETMADKIMQDVRIQLDTTLKTLHQGRHSTVSNVPPLGSPFQGDTSNSTLHVPVEDDDDPFGIVETRSTEDEDLEYATDQDDITLPSAGVDEDVTWGTYQSEPSKTMETLSIFKRLTLLSKGIRDHAEEFSAWSDDDDCDQGPVRMKDTHELALDGLRQVLKKPDAVWSSQAQKDVVIEVLKRKTDVCAFLRTGAGKTMLALIPATVEDSGVTVVVLPLKSLVSDYKRKLTEMDIPFDHYTGRPGHHVTGNRSLILVSADKARDTDWKQTISKIYHDGVGVNRFVFDEAQLALTSEDFRPALRNIEEIRCIPVPIVVLSATVPPSSEKALAKAFGLCEDRVTVRMCTDRPELEYTVQQPSQNHDETVSRTVALVKAEMKTFRPQDRALVFVSLKEEEGRPIAESLDCDFYQGGGLVTDEEREEFYQRWIAGTNPVMVCTHAFGAGNDYPHVRLVVHAGTPKQMIGYIQEVGRAGRDGQSASCVLIPRKRSTPGKYTGDPLDGFDHRGYQAVWNMVYRSTDCIRFSLTSFTDTQGVHCEPGSPKCSRCKSKIAIVIPKRKLSNATVSMDTKKHKANFQHQVELAQKHKAERSIVADKYTEDALDAISLFLGTCSLCAMVGFTTATKHPIVHCPTLDQAMPGVGVHTFREWQRKLQYSSKLHGKINDHLHATFRSGGKGCDDDRRDIVAPVAFGVWCDETLRSQAQVHFNSTWTTLDAYRDWLNGVPAFNHPTNMFAIFLWYSARVFKPL